MKDKKDGRHYHGCHTGMHSVFYLGGMLGQLFSNYAAWMQADGLAGEAAMKPVSWNPVVCFPMAFTPDGLKGLLGILILGGGVFAYVKLHDKFDGKAMTPEVSPKARPEFTEPPHGWKKRNARGAGGVLRR